MILPFPWDLWKSPLEGPGVVSASRESSNWTCCLQVVPVSSLRRQARCALLSFVACGKEPVGELDVWLRGCSREICYLKKIKICIICVFIYVYIYISICFNIYLNLHTVEIGVCLCVCASFFDWFGISGHLPHTCSMHITFFGIHYRSNTL